MTRLGVLLLLGLAACSAPQAPSTEKCDFWCKRDRTEASLLKPGQVQRRGDQLILTLQSGKRLTLTDYERGCEKTGYDDSCGSYYLTQVNGPGRAYVVHKSFYEGFYYYLIDIRSGRQIQLEGEPVFSPQGDRFLVSPNDYFGEPKNNLEIWRREGDGAVLEWSHSYEEPLDGTYDAKVVSWESGKIVLELPGQMSESKRATLMRDGEGWRVVSAAPAPDLSQAGTDASP